MNDLSNYIIEKNDLFSLVNDEKPETEFDIENYVYDLIKNYQNYNTITESVYILSKGRADCGFTHLTLQKDNIPYKIMVEPQDYDDYIKYHDPNTIVKMDKNNGGIEYVRNYIKEYSKNRNEKWHWQMDDDIQKFKIRINDKNIETKGLNNLSIVEKTTKLFNNVAISGLASSAFAFSKKVPVKVNQLAYSCVLANNDVDIKWSIGGCEDWHYTLNVLEDNWCTISFSHILFDAPGTAVQKGGSMVHWESKEKRKKLYDHFVSFWPKNFVVKPMTGPKGWKLQHKRRFFADYKQKLILN